MIYICSASVSASGSDGGDGTSGSDSGSGSGGSGSSGSASGGTTLLRVASRFLTAGTLTSLVVGAAPVSWSYTSLP